MTVELLHYTPLWVASTAIRKCWNTESKSDTDKSYNNKHDIVTGEKDKELIYRVGNKNKHSSTLEHISYSFDIDGISRACLQELTRHRISSPTVKSTRYTLRELRDEEPFSPITHNSRIKSEKYLVKTGNALIDDNSIRALDALRNAVSSGIANDITKFCLPESYKTSLVWTINARSLQNLLVLRTHKSAMWEIRLLANKIFETLPEEHRYLFEEYIYKEKEITE